MRRTVMAALIASVGFLPYMVHADGLVLEVGYMGHVVSGFDVSLPAGERREISSGYAHGAYAILGYNLVREGNLSIAAEAMATADIKVYSPNVVDYNNNEVAVRKHSINDIVDENDRAMGLLLGAGLKATYHRDGLSPYIRGGYAVLQKDSFFANSLTSPEEEDIYDYYYGAGLVLNNLTVGFLKFQFLDDAQPGPKGAYAFNLGFSFSLVPQ